MMNTFDNKGESLKEFAFNFFFNLKEYMTSAIFLAYSQVVFKIRSHINTVNSAKF